MMINLLPESGWKEYSTSVSSSCISPLTGTSVSTIIPKKLLSDPYHPIINSVKRLVKKIFRLAITPPNLYYEENLDFGFFPRPSEQFLSAFYLKQGTFQGQDLIQRIKFANSKTLNLSANQMLDWIMQSTGQISKSVNIVDFGAGSGWFSLALKQRLSAKVLATDFSLDAISHLRSIDKDIEIASLDDFFASNDGFDLLISVDVFEHLSDPLGTLKRVFKKANSGAHIFISVPNFGSFFSMLNLGTHPYYAYPPHLNYFTSKSMKTMLELAGIELIDLKITTLPWEVEYIARLYPKQQTGWELFDILTNNLQGERLFALATKR